MVLLGWFEHFEKNLKCKLKLGFVFIYKICSITVKPGVLANSCKPATGWPRFDQMAAWMDSWASWSQVWWDRIAVLKAGSCSEDQWSSRLWRGGYKAPIPPQRRCRITYFTANLCGPVGQTAAWVLVAKFLSSPATKRRFRSWYTCGGSLRH